MTLTPEQNLAIAKAGVRINPPHSLFIEALDIECSHPTWRTILCYQSETDVVECSRCGAQRLTACNFDDEYD